MTESALFLFAHQDDECFAATAILDELARGADVRVVFLTDGAARGVAPGIRDRESLRGLASLGVGGDEIEFLGTSHGVGDGRLRFELPRVFERLATILATDCPERIYGHDWEGGHPDHDAASLLTFAIARRLGKLESTRWFSLYNGHDVPRGLFRVLKPLAGAGRSPERTPIERRTALRLLAMPRFYPSQWKSWAGLYPEAAYHFLVRRRSTLVRLDGSIFERRPHEGPMLYETRFATGYEEFVRSTAEFRREQGIAPVVDAG